VTNLELFPVEALRVPRRRRPPEAGRYSTIVVDPPWPQKGAGTLKGRFRWLDSRTGASAAMPYRTMTVEEIAALPLGSIAARDAHLYLWTTNGFLPDAFAVLAAWGFRYSTTLVWAKTPMGGGLGGAFGISTEFLLHARRGNLPALGRIGRTWFRWKRLYDHRGKPMHSAKPPDAYATVETISPAPRLEMFARRPRPGWDVWGDEAPGSVEIPGLPRMTGEAAS
jgi:N6-adenosine-specific RNA methylase IME4